MRITRVETVRLSEHPRLVWVLVHTDDGVTGVGETWGTAGVIARAVHDCCAPALLGADPTDIVRFWERLSHDPDTGGGSGVTGAELRAASACDLALWDIVAVLAGQPLYRILGGATRERLPLIAACRSWGSTRDAERARTAPGDLARELLTEGYTAIKVAPFAVPAVPAVPEPQREMSREGLVSGVGTVTAIREAVGDALTIVVDARACRTLPDAVRLARALEPYDVRWLEQPFPAENPATYASLAAATRVPLGAGGDANTTHALIAGGAVSVVTLDAVTAGGITGARAIAAHAARHLLPVAPLNAGGPVGHLAAVHLAATLPHAGLLEAVRADHRGWFPDIVDTPPAIDAGHALLPALPGLGAALLDEVRERPDAEIEASDAS